MSNNKKLLESLRELTPNAKVKPVSEGIMDKILGTRGHIRPDHVAIGTNYKEDAEKAEIIARVKQHDSGKMAVFVSDADIRNFDEFKRRYDDIFGSDEDDFEDEDEPLKEAKDDDLGDIDVSIKSAIPDEDEEEIEDEEDKPKDDDFEDQAEDGDVDDDGKADDVHALRTLKRVFNATEDESKPSIISLVRLIVDNDIVPETLKQFLDEVDVESDDEEDEFADGHELEDEESEDDFTPDEDGELAGAEDEESEDDDEANESYEDREFSDFRMLPESSANLAFDDCEYVNEGDINNTHFDDGIDYGDLVE